MVNVGLSMCNIGEYLIAMVLDSENEDLLIIDIPNTLRDMKRYTRSDLIEIGDIKVEGQPFKCIYPAKVSDSMHISAIDNNGKPVYRGSIIILASRKENGREILRGLDEEEVNLLKHNIGIMIINRKDGETSYNAYVLCNVTVINRRMD